MKFWGVEVKAGETLKVSPGEGNVIHLSQAAIGESYMGKAESVPLYVKVGEQKLVIGTLSAHMFPQIQFDVVLDEDFELCHNSRYRSVFFCGYRAQNPEEDEIYSGDDYDSESEDEEFPIENSKPEPVKAAATKQVPSGNSKVKIDQHQPVKRPIADSDEYSSDEEDYSDYGDENGKPEPVNAAATKQVPSGNSKVKIDQHQPAKRPTAAIKQVPSGNSKAKIDWRQPAKKPIAYSDEYCSDEDDYSDYDDENGKPEPVKAAATKQVPYVNSKVKIDQHQPAKRATAAIKQVPYGNSKVKIDQHQPAKRPIAYSDEDSSDEYDFSDSDDEGLSDGYDDDEIDGSFDEEYEKIPTPKKDINKRPIEPASKTPVPPKKATFATPQKSTAGKKATATHTATPHPAKQAAKTTKIENAKTPVSAGKATCNYCRKTFSSNMALVSHSKAKHAAAAAAK